MSSLDSRNGGSRRTNLIVNYLPQSMSDEQFRVLFAKYGDLRSARIIRNKATGYSYGFGFVDYFNASDAEMAIDNLSGTMINHKTIKVSYARPSGDDIKNANLYVTNLPPSFDEHDVRCLFEPFGEIIQCRLLGNRAGSAFVLFNLHDEAEQAMKELNQQNVPGTSYRMSIKFATEQKKRIIHDNTGQSKSSHHKYPPTKVQKRTFTPTRDVPSHKRHNGSHHSSRISGSVRGSYSHNSRYNSMGESYDMSFGLVPLMDEFDSSDGYSTFSGHGGHYSGGHSSHPPSFARHGLRDDDQSGEYTLFVYNIGNDATENELHKLFSHYGPIERVDVMRKTGGEGRGFGFVTMRFYDDACNAIAALDGYRFIGNKPLQVSFKRM